MIRDELLAALPAPPPAARSRSTGSSRSTESRRAAHPHVVDEDGHRILRTLVEPRAAVAVGAAFLVVAAVLLVAAETGPDRRRRHRPVRDLRLRRSARRHRAAAPGRRPPSRGTGRHDSTMTSLDRSTTSTPAIRRRVRRRAARRALLPAPRRRRAPRRSGASRRSCSSSLFVGLGTDTSDGRDDRPGARAGRSAATRSASSCSRSPRSSAVVVPVVVVGRRWSCRQRWRRLGLPRARRRGRCRGLCVVLDAALDVPGRLPGAVDRAAPGWRRRDFPSLALPGRRGRGRRWSASHGSPRSWRRAADLALARPRRSCSPIAGTAGVPELLLARGRRRRRGRRRPRRVRRAEPPADAGDGRGGARATAGFDVAALTLQRAEGGRAQLYVARRCRRSTRRSSRCTRTTAATPISSTAATARSCCADPNDDWPSMSLEQDVEHEALPAADGA